MSKPTNKPAGIIDNLGYAFCVGCAETREKTGRTFYTDNSAMHGDCCDGCRKVFTH